MISLRKSLSAYDQLEALNEALVHNYASTVQDLQEAAIPLRGDATRHYREVLKSIEARIRNAGGSDDLDKNRQLLREELLDYQKQGAVIIEGLRESVTTISRVLEEVTASMNEDSTTETDAIGAQITRLQALVATDDLEQLRSGLRAAISGIASSVESLRRQNRLVVAQFREEIRTLHAQIRNSQSAAPSAPAAAPTASAVDPPHSIRAQESAAFSLIAIWIKNWKHGLGPASAVVKAKAFETFGETLARALGYRPVMSRYEEDLLLLRLNLPQADAFRISKDISSLPWPEFHLPGDDKRPIQWRVSTGIVSGRVGEPSEKLMARFDHLVKALRKAG